MTKQKTILSGTALVIDDQEITLSVTRDMLTARGMKVLLAQGGAEGVEVFREHYQTIDVVLLDFKMPDLNGEEVYIQLKEIDPEVRVVIVTGLSEDEALDQVFNQDEVFFIQKPFRLKALTEIVSRVLQQTS